MWNFVLEVFGTIAPNWPPGWMLRAAAVFAGILGLVVITLLALGRVFGG
jgi:hypothetical protein